MDLSNIKIETNRLILLSATSVYAKQVFKAYTKEIALYMNYPPPTSLEILRERMIQRESEMRQGLLLYMVVLEKASGEFLGNFALDDLDQKHPEWGGWLTKNAQGKGFGKEAMIAFKKWADENLDFEYGKWPCAKENIASCKLAESLGGIIHGGYIKTNKTGFTWEYLDYRIGRGE